MPDKTVRLVQTTPDGPYVPVMEEEIVFTSAAPKSFWDSERIVKQREQENRAKKQREQEELKQRQAEAERQKQEAAKKYEEKKVGQSKPTFSIMDHSVTQSLGQCMPVYVGNDIVYFDVSNITVVDGQQLTNLKLTYSATFDITLRAYNYTTKRIEEKQTRVTRNTGDSLYIEFTFNNTNFVLLRETIKQVSPM